MASIGDPRSWYPVALSSELGSRPHPISVFDRNFVLFRDEAGQPAALGRYCAHMGADLSLAKVVRGGLQCGIHGWEYDTRGICRRVPGVGTPAGVHVSHLACVERGDVIFVWPGPEPDWPFPAIPGLGTPRAARPRLLQFTCPVSAIALNGFDVWHFDSVHRRQVLSTPEVQSAAPGHLGIAMTAAVRPGRIYDNALIALGYGTLRVQIDNWGGNLILVRNRGGGYVAMLGMVPTGADSCRMYLTVLDEARKTWVGHILQSALLEIYRAVAWAFVKSDVPVVSGMRPKRGYLIPGRDDAVETFWQWWHALPRIEASPA
jgi:phenylpropionate dioxygenase-like ring-hydroxylating dioxygenase large terminal subunit